MFKRGKYVALCSTSWIAGESSRRLRCRIICIFSQRLLTGMHLSAISRNGLSAGSTKHIALRIVGRLCQTAPQSLGDGKKVVSIACCDLMNPCLTNGNTSERIRYAPALSNIRMTGHISFNSMLNELASDTDNPDLERTGSCSYWRGRFRRKRNPDFSREGRLLAESESGEAGHAGSIRERSRISLGMVSRTPPTDS